MFFERIVAEGLMQYSYFFGDDGKAFVIDPHYDIDVYLKLAEQHQVVITDIFETHRNEDLLLGSKYLADVTGAKVHLSKYEALNYQYGERIGESDCFKIGQSLKLKPLHTPGHTKGHLSYLLSWHEQPYIIFTGDALFYGGVGRSDFYGEQELEEMTRRLYDSLFNKIKPLGDAVLVMPAHGPGSACGDDMDDRPYSTIGFEFATNPYLKENLEDFIKENGVMRYKNHAFEAMEAGNLRGGGMIYTSADFLRNVTDDVMLIDLRSRRAFIGMHLPGSLCMPVELLNSYLGWYVKTSQALLLVADGVSAQQIEQAQRSLLRQGFHNIKGILGDGSFYRAATAGKSLAAIDIISAEHYLSLKKDSVTLDVRKDEELSDDDPLHNPLHIPYQELLKRSDELDGIDHLYVLCGSGERATVAASWLKSARDIAVTVIEGGMQGLRAIQCDK